MADAKTQRDLNEGDVCPFCGKDADLRAMPLTRLSCTRCEDTLYHPHCVDKYLRNYREENKSKISKHVKAGFLCPVGRGKLLAEGETEGKPCTGRIEHRALVPVSSEDTKESMEAQAAAIVAAIQQPPPTVQKASLPASVEPSRVTARNNFIKTQQHYGELARAEGARFERPVVLDEEAAEYLYKREEKENMPAAEAQQPGQAGAWAIGAAFLPPPPPRPPKAEDFPGLPTPAAAATLPTNVLRALKAPKPANGEAGPTIRVLNAGKELNPVCRDDKAAAKEVDWDACAPPAPAPAASTVAAATTATAAAAAAAAAKPAPAAAAPAATAIAGAGAPWQGALKFSEVIDSYIPKHLLHQPQQEQQQQQQNQHVEEEWEQWPAELHEADGPSNSHHLLDDDGFEIHDHLLQQNDVMAQAVPRPPQQQRQQQRQQQQRGDWDHHFAVDQPPPSRPAQPQQQQQHGDWDRHFVVDQPQQQQQVVPRERDHQSSVGSRPQIPPAPPPPQQQQQQHGDRGHHFAVEPPSTRCHISPQPQVAVSAVHVQSTAPRPPPVTADARTCMAFQQMVRAARQVVSAAPGDAAAGSYGRPAAGTPIAQHIVPQPIPLTAPPTSLINRQEQMQAVAMWAAQDSRQASSYTQSHSMGFHAQGGMSALESTLGARLTAPTPYHMPQHQQPHQVQQHHVQHQQPNQHLVQQHHLQHQQANPHVRHPPGFATTSPYINQTAPMPLTAAVAATSSVGLNPHTVMGQHPNTVMTQHGLQASAPMGLRPASMMMQPGLAAARRAHAAACPMAAQPAEEDVDVDDLLALCIGS